MKISKTVLLLIALTILSTQILQPAWFSNDPPIPSPLKSIGISNDVKGASHHLQAMASLYLLLNESELSQGGIIASENATAKYLLDDIIIKLSLAKEYFYALYIEVRDNPIDATTLYRFKNYNYDMFGKSRRCNIYVLNRVKYFLSTGDLPGYELDLVKSIDQCLASIKQIATSFQTDGIIHLESLQSAYERLNDSMLSGYYSSLIFAAIK